MMLPCPLALALPVSILKQRADLHPVSLTSVLTSRDTSKEPASTAAFLLASANTVLAGIVWPGLDGSGRPLM